MATLPEVEGFTHDHVFLGAAHDDNARRTLWVVVLKAGMMVIEIVAGYVTGSMALLADGFHMAAHAGALGCCRCCICLRQAARAQSGL